MNSSTSNLKHSTKGFSSIWEENLRYTPWILGILAVFMLNELVFSIINDQPATRIFGRIYLLLYLEFLAITYFTINSVYAFKRIGKPYCKSEIEFLVVKLVGLVIGVLIVSLIIEYIYAYIGFPDDDYVSFGGYQLSASATNIVTNEFYALLIGIPTFLLQANKAESNIALQQKQMELERLEQLKVQSELAALQAKINPHFLYNSLNSIVSLIHENPNKAEQMVLSLSDLFRYSVNSRNSNYATLEEELEMVNTYLDIELVRFEGQLNVEINIADDVRKCRIPKFLIQPLIENAIKHGTSKVKDGIIKLTINRTKHNLMITLFDNGPNFPEDIDAGYGIRSTAEKLDLLYGDQYTFQLLNSPEKHIKIELQNAFNHV